MPGDLKTVEEIAKLAGKCLRLEFDKRTDMLEVAERLRKLRNAAHERTARFSWGRRYKPAQAQTKSSQESNIRSQIVRSAAPAKVAPSQESNSRRITGIERYADGPAVRRRPNIETVGVQARQPIPPESPSTYYLLFAFHVMCMSLMYICEFM
jgi:hypothetical protein